MRRNTLALSTVLLFASVLLLAGCAKNRSAKSTAALAEPVLKPVVKVKKDPPKPQKPQKEFIEAKGLHVTGWIAGGKRSFGHMVDLCDKTELNALCIDVKDSDGLVSFDTNVPLEREIKASAKMIPNIDRVMETMKKHNIYPIARIACFKDPVLAKRKPELAVQSTAGGIWKDRAGDAWANPYDKRTWDYNIDIAIDCAKRGFKEIQWDYVRFPSEGKMSECVFPGKTKASEAEVIDDFLAYAKKRLEPYPVLISADIFGLTSIVKHDMGIGQTMRSMAKHVDYICPMVYPSHYALGEYGMPNPDVQPYRTVHLSLRDALVRVKGTKCKIRPWLQDFSLRAHYGKAEVLAQRKAAKELGIKEFLMWNPRCRYTESALAVNKKALPDTIAKDVPAPTKPEPKEKAAERKGG